MDIEFPYSWLYAEHPLKPIAPRDPLVFFEERRQQLASTVASGRRIRLAYAARWEPAPEGTWSGSATSLLARLGDVADVDDIGVHFPDNIRRMLRVASARYHGGEIKSNWSNSRLTNAYMDRHFSGVSARGGSYDAMLTIDSLSTFPQPYFIYYDVTWDSLLGSAETPELYMRHARYKPGQMRRMVARQRKIYDKATAVFTMSHWLARSLVEESGIPESKVHVIHPGMNTGKPGQPDRTPARGPRRRLLFIGRQWGPETFYLKGADLVVQAFKILRREYDPELTLTMVGVTDWPLSEEVPEGVTLPGVLSAGEVRKLYGSHDLLVVPSRLEGFGIVFAEATASGMPCVARTAYAMPEVVVPGLSGALIDNDDPHDLAKTIASVLGDEHLYESCRTRAPEIADYFSWERAAWEISQIITREIS